MENFDFLRIFKPQKVKNIATSIPLAAAVVARVNAAIALSISPENRIMVILSFILLFPI
jgi:hypothetical protein